MGKRVLLLPWRKVLCSDTLMQSGGRKILLWMKVGAALVLRLGAAQYKFYRNIFHSSVLCGKGNVELQHWQSSLELCGLGWRGERIFIQDLLLRLILCFVLSVCASASHHFSPGSLLPPSFGAYWPCSRVFLDYRNLISAGLCCTQVLQRLLLAKGHQNLTSPSGAGAGAEGHVVTLCSGLAHCLDVPWAAPGSGGLLGSPCGPDSDQSQGCPLYSVQLGVQWLFN